MGANSEDGPFRYLKGAEEFIASVDLFGVVLHCWTGCRLRKAQLAEHVAETVNIILWLVVATVILRGGAGVRDTLDISSAFLNIHALTADLKEPILELGGD